MSDRPKLPRSIVVLNVIMIVIILVICALAAALFVQSKELGWSLPVPDSSSAVSESASAADGTAEGSAITIQAETAEGE